MLAIAESSPSSEALAGSDPEVHVTVTVVYSSGEPLKFQFDTPNYILVDAGSDTVIRMTLKMQEGVVGKFSSAPILWSSYPGSHSHAAPPGVILEDDQQTIRFSVPAPTSYLFPWWFRLSIDAAGLRGIVSPSFFIARRPSPDGETCRLIYDAETGSFTLTGTEGALHDSTLINTLSPFDIRITLEGASFSGPATSQSPIVWTTGVEPGWFSVSYDSPNQLTLTIDNDNPGYGQVASFKFAVEYNGVQFLSPDPILINATLGDGN